LWLIHRDFANYRNTHSAKFYRWINEIPAVFLIAMVLLAVLKPAT
jgi:putative membrane protein